MAAEGAKMLLEACKSIVSNEGSCQFNKQNYVIVIIFRIQD